MRSLVVIYDGDCPFCSNVALKRQLDEASVALRLIDARQLPASQLAAYRARGYDLNQGMLVETGDQLYFGHDALQVLIEQSRHRSWLVRRLESIYSRLDSPRLYGCLVRARLLLLKLLDREPITPTREN